jgi:hypothetical protein
MAELEMELSGSEETLEVDTPSPETNGEETTEADPAPEVTPEEPTVELFDLPDGRKVTASDLKEEYYKLLPEFTKKSQRLAEYEKGKKDNINSNPEGQPEWKNPDYTPKTYAEIIELAKAEAVNDIRRSFEEEQARTKAFADQIEGELSEIRKIDPKLDENALFVHANKYGLQNLKFAHQNMMDMRKAILDTEQKTIKNLKTRDSDPVSAAASPTSVDDDGYDPSNIGQYQSASEFLARIKGNKK